MPDTWLIQKKCGFTYDSSFGLNKQAGFKDKIYYPFNPLIEDFVVIIMKLFVISILVGRQLYKVRKDELKLIRLEKEDSKTKEDSSKMYELASVQLKKRLYPQATSTLKQALKKLEGEPD